MKVPPNLAAALLEFEAAAERLNDAWAGATAEEREPLNAAYPFANSFDDVTHDVTAWADSIRNKS